MAALGTRKLMLIIDGEERYAEVTTAEITNEESEADTVTFKDASEGGGRDWKLHIVALQDPGDPDSLFNLIWDRSGESVEVVVMPYGNSTPTATEPHFEGTVVVKLPDGVTLGGEADSSQSARFTLDTSFDFEDKPTKITA